MPVLDTDIVLRYSGGASNTDPNASLGGVLSTVAGGIIDDNVLHDLYDRVSGAERTVGDTEYRGAYVTNAHATLTLFAAVIWVPTNTVSAETTLDIALAAEAVNVTMATIADEQTAPTGVTFSAPSTEATALSIGDIPAGGRKGFWLRRTIGAGTTPLSESATLQIAGDTD